MAISMASFNFEVTLLNRHKRAVERASTKVVHKDGLQFILCMVKAVGDGSCRGLVDHLENIETCDFPSVNGGLTLIVVEVGRNCYDCVLDRLLSSEGLCNLSHLNQDHG